MPQATLLNALHQSVLRYPEHEAIVHLERRVSYRELWTKVEAVAAYLRSRNIAKGDRVAVLLENSVEYVACYYGILAAGGVVVALNTSARAPEIMNLLRHSRAILMFANTAQPEHASLTVAPEIALCTSTLTNGAINPAEACQPEQLAAIIYTSGTTGKPKGIMLSHRNLMANTAAIVDYLKLTAQDRVLNVLPFFYSYGNSVLHTHLMTGGTIVLENSLMYPHSVLKRIASERITGFSGVANSYAILFGAAQCQKHDLHSLRYLTQAGGAMDPNEVLRIKSELSHAQLFLMYGQTEATARIAYLPPEYTETKPGSVGIAVAGVSIQIRDAENRIVPTDTVGEIHVKGASIMSGYLDDPEATARVLADGWLRTGDLGRIDADGHLWISGRSSDIIKSGAHRVCPLEIEEVIAELGGIREVAVFGSPDEQLGQAINAVIILHENAELQPLAIKAHCRARLAQYKIPKHVRLVNEIPRTASGKVMRFKLGTNPSNEESYI